MRRTVAGLVGAMMMAGIAAAQDAGEAIRTTIQNQLDAFQADDFETAFTFASPLIQGIFQTPERFGQMVTSGYPMVHRPADIQFTDDFERAGLIYQNVLITDQAGALHLLEYEMIETSDGWEINGVRFLRPDALGA